MHRTTKALLTTLVLALALGAAPALAANIVGTSRADTLRGTPGADRLRGLAGNDRLLGLAGNDVLVGGAGNDVLVGGPGADRLDCGPGRDRALADPRDRVNPDCELVSGLPKPALSLEDVSVDEGNAGTTTVTFSVTLAEATQLPVTVAYATQDGTATAPHDYAAVRGTLRFAPGETATSVTVSVVADNVAEADEAFALALSAPANATLGRGSATATIRNDDPRSGAYGGSTSQGKRISFDVAGDLSSVTNLYFGLDVVCRTPYGSIPISDLDFGPDPEPIALDGNRRFGFSERFSDRDGHGTFTFSGGLAVGSPATGSFQLDMVVYTSIGNIPCTTGNVTWTAG